jgi:polyisoprenyl-phosphate glycosyltransferase
MIDPVDVVIPARNEEKTIGNICNILSSHLLVKTVIVVCDSCKDDTDLEAWKHGADIVLSREYNSKGQTVMTGLSHVVTDRVMLMDADLTGLHHMHVTDLIGGKNVLALTGMRIGVPDLDPGLPYTRDWAWPWVSGQRVVPTSLVKSLSLHGYLMETQINAAASRAKLPVSFAWLTGLKSSYNMTERRLEEMNRDLQYGKQNGILL